MVAYALAGNTNVDLTSEPLGYDQKGQPVYLMDLMPEHDLVTDYVQKYVTRQLFEKEYAHMFDDNENGIRFRQPLLKIISGIRLRPIFKIHLTLMV